MDMDLIEAGSELPEAVQILAAAQLGDPQSNGVSAAEELAAVACLREAPPEDVWNRGVLLGLRSRRPEVVDATVEAAVDRLARLAEPEAQDGLMTAILDACFLHLPSGRRLADREESGGERRRAAQIERAGARLIEAVTRLLRNGSSGYEHHRARLLAQARHLKHRQGRGFLAKAVVALQNEMAEGDGSDALVTAELVRRRKLDVYTSPHSTETALLAYLDHDRRLSLPEVSQELLQAYRILLAVHTKERARPAILRAMDNLVHWLEATPQSPHQREEVVDDALRLVRLAVPRDQLDPRVGRHLEAHLELLPGPDHPEDLLRQLVTRYDSAEGEEILVRGLELLRRLPLVRLRSEELCGFILAPARRQRSAAVWQALLGLVESLITGLADFVLTRGELDRREERRLRLLRELLVHDQRLRDLLYRLATETGIALSHDAPTDGAVRESAWRILLRCLPQDRVALQREGLLEHGGRFFFATLAEAGQAHRREVWEALLAHWDALAGPGWPHEERHRRVLAMVDFFRRTGDYAAVQEEAGGPGPLLRLAFDDPDFEIRARTEAALVESGYGLEVQRERERRHLLELRGLLSASNDRVIALEAEVGRLGGEAITAQAERVDQGLSIQEQLQLRESLLTRGWLFTSSLQADLEEVRLELVEALARAEAELVLLRQLQSRMEVEHREAHQAHAAVRTLVGQQEQKENDVRRLQGERSQAMGALSKAQGRLNELTSRRSWLQNNRPSPPSSTGDPERDAEGRDAFRRQCQAHERELADVSVRIADAEGDIRNCRRRIESCEGQIAHAEREIAQLQSRIDQERRRVAEIRRRVEALGHELAVRQASLAAIRREIDRLTARSQQLQSRQGEHDRQVRADLGANTGRIEEGQARLRQIHAHLQEVSTRLNQTGHERDRQRTESQRLVQAIDSGREEYDRTAERARPESARADAAGHSHREAHERELTAGQEAMVQYAEGIHHALRLESPLPARPTRPRRPRRTATKPNRGG